MSERRSFVRATALARLRVEPLAADQHAAACARVRAAGAYGLASAPPEESLSDEARIAFDLLRHVVVSLERIESRLDRLLEPEGARRRMLLDATVEVSLSASGLAIGEAPALALERDDSAWLELDLPGAGVPAIRAVARFAGRAPGRQAFEFTAIAPGDRERIVALAIRSQSQALRAERMGEA